MGKINDVLQRYLSDRERFADLFNVAYFHGEQVIMHKDLKEENVRYADGQQRDIKMCMRTGSTFRILALENETLVSRHFSDYPMRLYCINEENDFSAFHTELKKLFMLLQYRQDKTALWNLVQNNSLYRNISQETAEAAAVLMNVEGMWRKRERYLHKYNEEVKYDMCQALQELFEDGRLLGMEQGIRKGIEQGIRACVELCREFGTDKENAARQVSQKFAMDREAVWKYIDRYWV